LRPTSGTRFLGAILDKKEKKKSQKKLADCKNESFCCSACNDELMIIVDNRNVLLELLHNSSKKWKILTFQK
ncbi:hypothetical protein ACJX0J_033114, partial [Zea mays]